MKTKLMIVAAALLFSTAAYAQNPNEPSGDVSAQSDVCAWTFSSGGGNSQLTWCVTVFGNMVRFESPAGFEHIRVGTFNEGYVLCSGTSVLAYDLAGSGQAGWGGGFAVLAGPSGSGITLRRFTADGLWQLDQKFSRDNKENDVTVLMTLKRLGPFVNDVRLARVTDFDNDNDIGDDVQDRSDRGIWARDIHAVSLSNITFSQFTDTAVGGGGAACSQASAATPTTADSFNNVTARLGGMGLGNTKKTTFVYRRQ